MPARTAAGAISGLVLTRRTLSATEVTFRGDVPTTTAVPTAVDLGRIRPPDEAVVAFDLFLQPGLVFLDEVRAAAALLRGPGLPSRLRGRRKSRRARRFTSGDPAPAAAAPIRAAPAGGSVQRAHRRQVRRPGRLRLAGTPAGTRVGGPLARPHQQVARDRRRLNDLTRAGWRVIFVTAADLRHPERLIARLAEELGAPRSA